MKTSDNYINKSLPEKSHKFPGTSRRGAIPTCFERGKNRSGQCLWRSHHESDTILTWLCTTKV